MGPLPVKPLDKLFVTPYVFVCSVLSGAYHTSVPAVAWPAPLNCRDFIIPVLTLSLLLARVKGSYGTRLGLAVEYNVVGKRAWGPVDYVQLYQTLGVMVAEVCWSMVCMVAECMHGW